MNERSIFVGEALSSKIAIVSEEQLAAHWEISSSGGRRHLTSWLGSLIRGDLLRCFRVLSKPIPPLNEPLAIFGPNEPARDSAALSWASTKRWAVEPRVTTVYVRGPRCVQLFGGNARPDICNLAAVSHDLALAELFLRFVRECPDRACDWTADWERKAVLGYGEKLPDVQFHTSDGRPYLALEMAGTYPPRRWAALQLLAAEQLKLVLEVW
jgi:hypothetical protein